MPRFSEGRLKTDLVSSHRKSSPTVRKDISGLEYLLSREGSSSGVRQEVLGEGTSEGKAEAEVEIYT